MMSEEFKNLIQEPKTEEDQLYENFNRMRCLALFEEDKNHLEKGSYKWEIGIGIYNKIAHRMNPIMRMPDEKRTLLGWEVEINMKDPKIIKLWREVKT